MFRFFAILGFLTAALATQATAATIAQIVALRGSVTMDGKPAQAGAPVPEHSKIAVDTGNAQILFSDGTKMALGDHSSLVIEKYLMQNPGSVSSFAVDALSGTFRFITGRSPKSAYDIQTANSTIGIRGTGFDFWVTRDTGVVVLVGRIRLCRKGGKQCIDVDRGCNAGIARSDGTRKLEGFGLSENIKQHLPFILNQSQLRADFRLPVADCDNVLRMTDQGHGSPPPPTPPPPPPPPPNALKP